MSREVAIVSAVRTPIGILNGSLADLSGHDLGSIVIEEALSRCAIPASQVSEVIMGQVLTAGQGQNPARQASIKAGVPYTSPAANVGMVCGSGLRSVVIGVQAIRCGDAQVVVAGGQESMSKAAHSVHLRKASSFGNSELSDTLLKDGLTDAFHGYHMGITAENVAKKYNLSRDEQDRFAFESQRKVKNAVENGYFDAEIVPVTVHQPRKKSPPLTISKDEFPKPNTTMEALNKLRPVFQPQDGTVTAGNTSGINDGAAAVVLMDVKEAEKNRIPVLAKVISYAMAGVEPEVMGLGPVEAVRKAVEKAGWSLGDVDLFELNEAFSSQSLACIRELGIDPEKVNVHGGSIALGHPIGASGCRILVTLIYALRRLNMKKGVASLCIGGGMGIAICIQI